MREYELSAISGDWHEELWLPTAPPDLWDATRDGAHVWWLEELKDSRLRFYWDGVPGRIFNEIMPTLRGERIIYSPDGLHVAFAGIRAGEAFVCLDGGELGPYTNVTHSVPITFSPDGTRLAFGAMIGEQAHMVLDGTLERHWLAAPLPPVFSPDSQRFAFISENRTLAMGEADWGYEQRLVVDGVELITPGPVLEEPRMLFSPDGRRFAYFCFGKDLGHVVIDGERGRGFKGAREPLFSPDSRHFAYVGGSGSGSSTRAELIVDGRSVAQGKMLGELSYSPDSERLAYSELGFDDNPSVVVGDERHKLFGTAWSGVVFSPDSRRVAYLVGQKGDGIFRRRQRLVPVVDGEAWPAWDGFAEGPIFSPDSRRIGFCVRQGKQWFALIDGLPGAAYDEVQSLRFTPAGKCVYLARRGRDYRIVVEGIEGPTFEEASFVGLPEGWSELVYVSPHGEHVAAVVRVAGGWRPIVDDFIGPAYASLGCVQFQPDRVFFVGTRPEGVFRVSISVD